MGDRVEHNLEVYRKNIRPTRICAAAAAADVDDDDDDDDTRSFVPAGCPRAK